MLKKEYSYTSNLPLGLRDLYHLTMIGYENIFHNKFVHFVEKESKSQNSIFQSGCRGNQRSCEKLTKICAF